MFCNWFISYKSNSVSFTIVSSTGRTLDIGGAAVEAPAAAGGEATAVKEAAATVVGGAAVTAESATEADARVATARATKTKREEETE